MRIVAGSLRGRRIEPPAGGDAARPTTDRVRESLFNILAHGDYPSFEGAAVLDAFAGSGALGFEALSRGAASVTFMDTSTATAAAIRRNADALGVGDAVTYLRADVIHPPAAPAPCALILMDPPYGQNLAVPALTALDDAGWIAPGAAIVIETAKADAFDAPDGFTEHDRRSYGNSTLVFLDFHHEDHKDHEETSP